MKCRECGNEFEKHDFFDETCCIECNGFSIIEIPRINHFSGNSIMENLARKIVSKIITSKKEVTSKSSSQDTGVTTAPVPTSI